MIKEKKYELNLAFRALVYARDQADFEEKLQIWMKEMQGVEVRIGGGQQAKYVCLADYYAKNWAPVQSMWARFERRPLPIGMENTTNRLERAFGVMKHDLKMSSIGDLTIEMAVVLVVRWAESKLEEACATAQRKTMKIFDNDPEITKEFENAALELNETGCLAFKKSIDLMKKNIEKMTVVEGGVKERFSRKVDDEQLEDNVDEENNDGDKKVIETVYDTSEKDCSCTRWRQDSHACRHILFLRRSRKLPMFDKVLFIEYFHLERTDDLDALEIEDIKDNNNDEDKFSTQPQDDDQEEEDFVLEPGEKYRLATESTTGVRDLMCHFGTPQFMDFLWQLEVAKRRMRRGRSIFGARRMQEPCVEPISDKVEDCDEHEKIEFLKKVNKKGRPKHSGAGKLMFPKPKKSSLGQKSNTRKTPETVKKNSKEVTESAATRELGSADSIVCLAPPVPGQWGDNTVTLREYGTLAAGKFVFDTVVNLWQRFILHQHLRLDDESQQVLLLSTECAVMLASWDPAVDPVPHQRLLNWTEHGGLWTEHGCRLVVLSICSEGHYYALVAVLDLKQPAMYVLESLGGSYAKEPPGTLQFRALLLWLRDQDGENGPDFVTSIPSVPRQREASNNCGLFLCQNVELILDGPKRFEDLARHGMLGNWYSVQSVDGKRRQVAGQIQQLAEDQRLPGGELDREQMNGRLLDLPLPEPEVVYEQVSWDINIVTVLYLVHLHVTKIHFM